MSSTFSYGRALRRGWWVVLLALGVSLAASAYVTSRQRPRYRSSATLVVRPTSLVRGASNILRSLETLERRSIIATFARIPGTTGARQQAAEALGVELSSLRRYRADTAVLPHTNILKLSVEGPEPELAAAFANALGVATTRQSRSLYDVYTLNFLEKAKPRSRPVFPDRRRNLVVAGLVGLFIGVVAAVVGERLRQVPPQGP